MKHYLHGENVLPLLAIALFALLFIAGPLTDAGALPRPFIGILLLIVTLAGLLALGDVHKFLVPVLVLFGVVFAIEAVSLVRPSEPLAFAKDTAGAVLVMLLCGLLLYVVMKPGRVTVNRIAGAIAVYLMAALLFALLYDLIERLDQGGFMLGSQPLPPAEEDSGFFYLSVITLTSVGFGDLSPVHPLARSSVMIEAVFGHIYTAVLLARLVSLEVADRISGSTS
jgi:Ion channel